MTNNVTEVRIYKRVQNGDPQMINLCQMRHIPKKGVLTPFDGTLYHVYSLVSNNYIYGYMLSYGQKTISERMYYAFEKIKGTEGES